MLLNSSVVHTVTHDTLQRMENYTSHRTHNDLWQIFTNTLDWKLNYIHPLYDMYVSKTRPEFPSPCPDVFVFPLLSGSCSSLPLFIGYHVFIRWNVLL